MIMRGDPLRVRRTAGFAKIVTATAGRVTPWHTASSNRRPKSWRCRWVPRCGAGWRPGDPWRVSWMGKVITTNPQLQARFRDLVATARPGITTADPYGIPLDGCRCYSTCPATIRSRGSSPVQAGNRSVQAGGQRVGERLRERRRILQLPTLGEQRQAVEQLCRRHQGLALRFRGDGLCSVRPPAGARG